MIPLPCSLIVTSTYCFTLNVVGYVTGYIMSRLLRQFGGCFLCCSERPTCMLSTNLNIIWAPNMSTVRPVCPLFYHRMTRCVYGRQTQDTRAVNIGKGKHVMRVLLGLNGWYTGLEVRLFHVSRDRLRLTSYAVLLTRSSDSSSCLLGLSICVFPSYNVLQPIEDAVATPGGLPTTEHVQPLCRGRLQPWKITYFSGSSGRLNN